MSRPRAAWDSDVVTWAVREVETETRWLHHREWITRLQESTVAEAYSHIYCQHRSLNRWVANAWNLLTCRSYTTPRDRLLQEEGLIRDSRVQDELQMVPRLLQI